MYHFWSKFLKCSCSNTLNGNYLGSKCPNPLTPGVRLLTLSSARQFCSSVKRARFKSQWVNNPYIHLKNVKGAMSHYFRVILLSPMALATCLATILAVAGYVTL